MHENVKGNTEAEQSALGSVEKMIGTAALEAERTVLAYRKTAFQRFPIIFGLLVLIGSAATVFALEQIFLKSAIIANHPVWTLLFGLAVLFVTGRLYKRLS